MEQIRVQIVFTKGDLTDALYIPIDEYLLLDVDTIEEMKQKRYEEWLIEQKAIIENANKEVPVEEQVAIIEDTIEQLQTQIEEYQEQKQQILEAV